MRRMPLAWRLQKEHAGSGALGDIGANIIDMTQFVTGQSVEAVTVEWGEGRVVRGEPPQACAGERTRRLLR